MQFTIPILRIEKNFFSSIRSSINLKYCKIHFNYNPKMKNHSRKFLHNIENIIKLNIKIFSPDTEK